MTTPQLGMKELEASQSQPEVIVNAALRALEAAISIRVLTKELLTPPASPASSARYLLAGGTPTGAWAGHQEDIAYLVGSAWAFLEPQEGWVVFVADENERYEYTGSGWIPFEVGGGSVTVEGLDTGADIVTDVTTIQFENALVEDQGGGVVKVTPEAGGPTSANEVDIGLFFPGGPPLTVQLLAKYVATRDMTFPANFAGSVGHIGTNPTGSFVMTVSVGGASAGTVTVNTSGVFSFATTAGAAVAVFAGDEIEIEAPVGTDATAADIALTLLAQV
jgi:hypothetical protein